MLLHLLIERHDTFSVLSVDDQIVFIDTYQKERIGGATLVDSVFQRIALEAKLQQFLIKMSVPRLYH